MSTTERPGWINAVRIDSELLTTDPLLVRVPNSADCVDQRFLDDLISWSAGIRDYTCAARDYLQARSWVSAAGCLQELDLRQPANAELLQSLRRAWDDWNNSIDSQLARGRSLAAELRTANDDPDVLADLTGAIRAVESARSGISFAADALDDDWVAQLANLQGIDWTRIEYDAESLDVAVDIAEAQVLDRTERNERDLAAVRKQAQALIGELLMGAGVHEEGIRTQALELLSRISDCIERQSLVEAKASLSELAALGGLSTLPQVSSAQPAESHRRSLSPLVEAELSKLAEGPVPSPSPPWLDDLPGWEWRAETLEERLPIAQRLATSGDDRSRDQALGTYLTIQAKRLLLDNEPDKALLFFRDAFGWAANPPRELRKAPRWRHDCAWGLLLSVVAAGMDTTEAEAILKPANLAALLQRPIGDLPLEVLARRDLMPDLANALLGLQSKSLETFFEEHLRDYFIGHPVALQDLMLGFADDLAERPQRVLEVYALILRGFGDEREQRTAEKLAKLARELLRSAADRAAVRHALDAAQSALHESAEHSDLAEAMRGGVAAHTADFGQQVTPRLAVELITREDGFNARNRLVLGISYTKGNEILRGVRLEATLRDPKDEMLAGGVESPIRIGRLTPRDRVEVPIARTHDRADLATTLATRILRRTESGTLSEVERLGKRLTLAASVPLAEQPTPDNPYIVGRAVHSPAGFYGREHEIKGILRALVGRHQDNAVLVLGERRIGKTTVLFQLQQHEEIKKRYIVVYRDMESAGDFNATSTFYREYLIHPIRQGLREKGFAQVPQSGQADVSGSSHAAFEVFMGEVDALLTKHDRRLLLILDELEKVLEENERPREIQGVQLPKEVLASIRSVLLGSKRISFVLAGVTDVVRRHLNDPDNRLFNLVVEIELQTLEANAAKALICEPAQAAYSVTPSARDMLLGETNCHPYLIQHVCRGLFEYMVDAGFVIATVPDVREVLKQRILPNAQPFSYLLESLRRKPANLAVVDTLASLQSGARYVHVGELAKRLSGKGRSDPNETQLMEALTDLAQQVPSLLERAPNDRRRYRLAIGLFASHRRLLHQTEHSLVVRAE
jgi:hypothetical protein